MQTSEAEVSEGAGEELGSQAARPDHVARPRRVRGGRSAWKALESFSQDDKLCFVF